ncbi:hypothetical protein C8J57DRAFT_953952, partial [Mycena rebaudengoi]
PSWLQEPVAQLTRVELGGEFHRLVHALVELERMYGFENGAKKLSARKRPKAIGDWIKDGHGCKLQTMRIVDVKAYEAEWWGWWGELQPTWHVRGDDGRLIIQDDYGGAWEGLRAPGINGCLSPVAALYWWGCAESENSGKTSEGWQRAVQDTHWV